METTHPEAAPLAFLVGTWRGTGEGVYPTIEPFTYHEQVEITAPPKPFLAYSQRTQRASTGEPLHMEVGYFRAIGTDAAELVVAQPTGVAEVHAGPIDQTAVHLTATGVLGTPTAKSVETVERKLTVDGDVLRYELLMGAVGQPHQVHLRAVLERI